jgi:hypothetical protein
LRDDIVQDLRDVYLVIQGREKKAYAHMAGELRQFPLQSHKMFFRIEEIVEPMDGGNIAFLVEFAHGITSLRGLDNQQNSQVHDIRIGRPGLDKIFKPFKEVIGVVIEEEL